MKFSLSKKILSIALCVILMALCAAPAFAADSCTCGHNPVIVVNGFASVPLMKGEETAFPPSTSVIGTEVLNLVKALATFTANKTIGSLKGDTDAVDTAYNEFIGSLVTSSNTLFNDIKCDTSGNPVYSDVALADADKSASADSYEGSSLDVALIPELANEIGNDHVYYFNYDWRKSLTDIADELDAFVDNVLSTTGHSKVSLAGLSMGGAIVNTYVSSITRRTKVSNVTMISSAFQGLEYIGELFTGHIEIDSTELAALIDDYLQADVELKSLLSYSGAYKRLLSSANDVIAYDQAHNNRIMKEILLPVFGQMPGMWAFVPAGYYEEALTYMFGSDARYGSYSGLVTKLDAYHAIQTGTKVSLSLFNSIGDHTLSIVSNYNTHIAPVTPVSKTLTSDGTIETIHTSAGATTAPIGESFPSNYTQAALTDKNYISPDKMIDASTCMFPEQTWFIKDMKHLGFDAAGNNCDLYVWLLTATEQLTVETSDDYPQFLIYNNAAKRLSCFYTAGDVNYDGKVNLVDARMALRGAMKFIRLTVNQSAPADMDNDGKVTMNDSQTIVQKVAGVA